MSVFLLKRDAKQTLDFLTTWDNPLIKVDGTNWAVGQPVLTSETRSTQVLSQELTSYLAVISLNSYCTLSL